ncbi:flavodoxin family protein [Streptomyces justiciae]|uniref:Flavodoxin domain-containing protein n=1 Tax=Streptomyces justiciae TaxID=2780140 RepID=A0ABU3M1R4_9ACTN|nr:flavodoxin domain-containing protein [Streptomyces justiciae]MDT7845446.1 flavodoxin domain-containing protein [Streptomyces justiciae]
MSAHSRPTVAVAFHSGYGHTAVIAEAVARGAAEAGAEVVSVPVDTITDEQWAQLDAADAIVFGAPTYMGTASAAFHAFAEASSKRWYTQTWADKIAAGFTNSGAKNGDKSSTLGYGSEDDLNRLGYFVGAGAQTPVDAGPDAVHKSDIATAEGLGARVAQQTAFFRAGRAALAA